MTDHELDQLIGLQAVKEEIKRVRARVRFDQERGIKSTYRHFMFTGNPGTGKTTVARILGRILYEVGFLKKTNFVEASRSTLVGQWVGHTTVRVQEQIDKALDGVLFIDEAHMLATSDSKNDFGPEALSAINKAMEDYRHRLVVIFAGYTEPMQRLYKLEPGLESRITRTIDFPDYSVAELIQIFDREVAARKVTILIEPLTQLTRDYFLSNELSAILNERGPQNFGNARGIRNITERLIDEHAYHMEIENIRGKAGSEIPFETLLSVLRSMYSNHSGNNMDVILQEFMLAQTRQWVEALERIIEDGKAAGSFGPVLGTVQAVEPRSDHYSISLSRPDGQSYNYTVKGDNPMSAMAESLSPGMEVTLISLGEGKELLAPGDFTNQLYLLTLLLEFQWQVLTDLESGLSAEKVLAKDVEDVISQKTITCPNCQKTAPPYAKFCLSCGSELALS